MPEITPETVRELLDKATPGLWRVHLNPARSHATCVVAERGDDLIYLAHYLTPETAAFVAAAPDIAKAYLETAADRDRCERIYHKYFAESAEWKARAEEAEAALARVRKQHNAEGRRWDGFPRADRRVKYCTGCNYEAPCPTIRALDGADS